MPQAIADALGGAAECSSRPLDPDGATVCVWRRPIEKLHVPPMLGYTLAVHTGGSPVVRFWTGREWSRAESRPGLLTLIPPCVPTSWLVDGAMDAVTVDLPVSRVESTAHEAVGRSATDLPFEFAFCDPLVGALVGALARELTESEGESALYLDRIHDLLALHLVRRRHRVRRTWKRETGALSRPAFERVAELMAARLEAGVSLEELARVAGLSRFHFARAFKRTVGLPPHEYFTRRRIERAQELLGLTDLPLAEIALRVGFSSQSHFTSVFARIAGASPAAYRRSGRGGKARRTDED